LHPTCVNKQAKPKVKQEVEQEECPLYKVLLIGDEEYERDHVVMAIQVSLLADVQAFVNCSLQGSSY
jgi:hypothetical protein